MPADTTSVQAAEDLLGAVSALRRGSRRAAGPGPVFASLTGAQADVLRLLYRQPGLSVTTAATELGMAPNSVSTLVGCLCRAGLVQRVRRAPDRRVVRLELTADARNRMSAWRDRRCAALAGALERLDRPERDRLPEAVALLRRLADAMEAV
ncbi:MarR family winged helix-turn-helix transcriptional regulator [Streptomyces sp. NPDC052396]|uniref:MarR family winged helix-turn-helix transcriptional regulator n=1 Tax=Streptomyces sp. NPDC052396 TaxID=3365689 RepID=UPI0037D222DD